MIKIGITKVADTNEYRVYWEDNGKDDESKAYYTDDPIDAVETLLNIDFRNETQGISTVISKDEVTSALIRKYNKSFGGVM